MYDARGSLNRRTPNRFVADGPWFDDRSPITRNYRRGKRDLREPHATTNHDRKKEGTRRERENFGKQFIVENDLK